MGINEKLMNIQTQIKAPKNMYNSFGKYKYRNAEGICEAVKPFLESERVSLTLRDDIVEVGGRIYVKATAELIDIETGEITFTTAYARESAEKKGMDDSQITGTASSYARKYALNGLFLLDDTKDADSDEYHNQTNQQNNNKQQPASDKRDISLIKSEQMGKLKLEMLRTGANEKFLCDMYKIDSINNLTNAQFIDAMQKFKNTPDRKKG